MRFNKKLLAAVCAVAIASPMAQPALAQTNNAAQMQNRMQAAPQQTIELTEKKMDQYLEAQQDVIDLNDKWSQKLQQASMEEKKQAAPQINNEMVEAVRDAGLSVEEFNQIAMAVRQNPELRQQVINELQ